MFGAYNAGAVSYGHRWRRILPAEECWKYTCVWISINIDERPKSNTRKTQNMLTCWWPKVKWLAHGTRVCVMRVCVADCLHSMRLYEFMTERKREPSCRRVNYGQFNETKCLFRCCGFFFFHLLLFFIYECCFAWRFWYWRLYCNRQYLPIFNDGFCLRFDRRWFQFFSEFTFTLHVRRDDITRAQCASTHLTTHQSKPHPIRKRQT